MKRTRKRTTKKAAMSPGTLVHVGERKAEQVRIRIVDYDEHRCEMSEASRIEEIFPFRDTPSITWINIDGIHEAENIEKLGKHFRLHPLLLEDILHTTQRPKVEDFDAYIFLILKILSFEEKSKSLQAEQFSLVLGPNIVITFQEIEGTIFNPIRERIRNTKGHHRRSGADYLAYSLVDAIIDNYFVLLESIGDVIEELEDSADPSPEIFTRIHRVRRDMILLRKSVWPLREVISGIQRMGSPLITDVTNLYLRDVYDHTIQVIDTIESFRDMASSIHETYLSRVSNRMNEVMKTLTVIATIFIPLTFIAGVYGMNFAHMPELAVSWLYPFGFWSIVVLVGGSMVLYFKKKKWL
jgi:magnesium transporter